MSGIAAGDVAAKTRQSLFANMEQPESEKFDTLYFRRFYFSTDRELLTNRSASLARDPAV